MATDNCVVQIKMDEILKMLFQVSEKVLLDMMNSLFKENFKLQETQISIGSNEFISEDLNVLRGDLFLTLTDARKPNHYHIEFQTINDAGMAIRMYEYGFNKAKELLKYDKAGDSTIYIPKQLVIFVEENSNIRDELRLRIVYPDGKEVLYSVPVMKYWHYDHQKLSQEKLYPLLPLQVFSLRYKIEQIRRKYGDDKERMLEFILEAKEVAKLVALEGKRLYRTL